MVASELSQLHQSPMVALNSRDLLEPQWFHQSSIDALESRGAPWLHWSPSCCIGARSSWEPHGCCGTAMVVLKTSSCVGVQWLHSSPSGCAGAQEFIEAQWWQRSPGVALELHAMLLLMRTEQLGCGAPTTVPRGIRMCSLWYRRGWSRKCDDGFSASLAEHPEAALLVE